MMFKILFFAFILTMTVNVFSQIQLEPGVSHELARWRAANYSDVRYKLNITLEKGAPLMKGDIEISVKLTETGAKNDLILDWRTTQFQNDKDKPYARVVGVNNATEILASESKEHLLIPANLLKTGENVIKIQFASPIKTSGAGVTRYVDKEDGAEYVYSLFVPSDASTAFPVFDQPDLKARFQLDVQLPFEWKVVSNTDSRFVDNGHSQLGYRSFSETKPISPYVFAFAAGDFEVFKECFYNKEFKGIDVTKCSEPSAEQYNQSRDWSKIYVRRSQAEKFKQHAAEVFRLNREGVKYLESYFDFKFPFPKYDLVLIPEFPFGGMEHAGCTFIREDSIIFPTEPTANNYISRANVMFHEAAHQWFGDTVTMKWFDDLWLKEGFAEFMAYKTLEKVMPQYNAWKAFYERNKPLAYLTDSTRGTTPIYQEIPNLSAAKSAYGNIVYRKAPSFLRQAEFFLGENRFQIAVRAFLKNHQYANAEWTDLVSEFKGVYGRNLDNWSETWVKKRGLPIFRIVEEPVARETNITPEIYEIFQKSVLQDSTLWQQKLKVLVINSDNSRQILDVKPGHEIVSDKDLGEDIMEPIRLNSRPNFLFPNYQDYGYGIFLLDEKSRAYVLANIQNEKDDFLRSMMWGTLWDSVREAELAPADYVRLAIKNISVEQDELTIQTILSRVSTAMNYYLSDKQRDELAPQLENLLIEKMRNAPTLGMRITFYRAFLNIASSEKARNVLKSILKGEFNEQGGNPSVSAGANPKPEIQNPKSNAPLLTRGLPPLKTKDKFDIATRLAILNDPDAPRILANLQKTETSDDAKRYAYAANAGFGTAENIAKFWNDFVNNKEISESWIESAFGPFNSTRHSDLTLPYLEKALAELPNLKRNRKIFFVNGWLGAFIGGQKSEQALAIVNKFLADNPNLDKDLRLKILENVDALERSVKIRNKFQ